MTAAAELDAEFDDRDERLRTMLPEQYRDSYDDVQPVSMGSAGLKYGSDGKVAWDQIWGSFCDLAMAGGPPHRGTLLVPGRREDIEAAAESYQDVVREMCRGARMVTGLFAEPASIAGWIRIYCTSAAMAGWLARAIVMENVSARVQGLALTLPAGPTYRIEKEIKNVVTSLAKTFHYWQGHTSSNQHQAIARLLARMDKESPLLAPSLSAEILQSESYRVLSLTIIKSIEQETGLRASSQGPTGWLGIDCREVKAAIWMMRTFVVSNMLSCREATTVFLPVDANNDPEGFYFIEGVKRAYRSALLRKIF